MKKILSKQDSNLITLIEILFKKGKSTFFQLQDRLSINPRTLTSLIQYGNSIFSPIRIDKNSAGIISLDIPSRYSLAYCYKKILENSIEFNILETLFFEQITYNDLSDKMYVSRSTLRRKILKINKTFVNLDIQINLKNLQIEGNEVSICNFYIYFFVEKYTDATMIFNENKVKFVDQILSNITEKRNIILDFPDIYRLKIWLLVILHRAGYVSKKISSIDSIENNYQFLSSFNELDLNRELNFRIKNNPFLEFIEKFFMNGILHTHDDLEEANKSFLFRQKKEKFEQILQDISREFKIKTSGFYEKLVVDLCNVSNLQFGAPYILFDKYSYFVENVSKVNKKFMKFIIESIYSRFPHISEYELNTYIYIMVTHWPNLLTSLQKSSTKLPVSIIVDTDIEHAYMIQNIIQTKYPDRFSIDILTDFKALSELPYRTIEDTVITTINDLMISNKKIFCVSIFPTHEELERIYDYYESTFEKVYSQ